MSSAAPRKRSRAGAKAATPPPPPPPPHDEAAVGGDAAPETPQAGSTEATAVVDYAKSSRSTCRVCNHAIEQGELRLGFEVEMRRRAPGHAAIGWRHLQCFHPPAGFEIAHLRGAPLLSKKDLARVARRLRKVAMEAEAHGLGPRRGSKGGDAREASPAIAAAAPPKRKKRHPEEFAARGVAGRHAAAAQALAHVHPGDARFVLTPGGPDVTAERAAAVRGKYDGMHVDELKEVLKANEQLLGGTKDELEARCTDGELRGGLPACPTCGIGRLHVAYDGEQATYSCPGYFDNEAKTFIRCPFTSHEVARAPWVMPGGAAQSAPGRV